MGKEFSWVVELADLMFDVVLGSPTDKTIEEFLMRCNLYFFLSLQVL